MRTLFVIASSVVVTLLIQSFGLESATAGDKKEPMFIDELHVKKLVVEDSQRSAYRAVIEGGQHFARMVIEEKQLVSNEPKWAGIWSYRYGSGPVIGVSDGYPKRGWDFALGMEKGSVPHIQVRNKEGDSVHVYSVDLPLRVRDECLKREAVR